MTPPANAAVLPLRSTKAGQRVLVRSADDAMYESKRLGRNRVSVAKQPLAVAG